MAIGTRTKPQIIVEGSVSRVREFKRKSDSSLLGHNIDIETDGGGVGVTLWASDEPRVPSVGEYVGIVAGVDEGERGAQLVYIRDVNPGDLDLIASNLFGKGK